MNDWNAQRRARGRIRRARLRRRRQRITIASSLVLLLLSALAIGTVDYGKKQSKRIEIATQSNRGYPMPGIAPILARAESPKPESDLPDLLNIEERFPDYREGLGRDDQDSGDEAPPEPPDAAPAGEIVILDDLRAAPPKSMFIKAVFEESYDRFRPKKPRRWLAKDFTDDKPDLFGKKKKRRKKRKDPPIPEPGTGILLGFGLAGIGSLRSAQRKRERALQGDEATIEHKEDES